MGNHKYNIDDIASLFEQDLYPVERRILYLKPNDYSEEAIAVGVLVRHEDTFDFSYVASQSAYEALSCFFGKEASEQMFFALNLVRDQIRSRTFDFESEYVSTSLLKFGSIVHLECENPKSYARDYLEIASSLYRTYECEYRVKGSVGQDEVRFDLYNSTSNLDAFRATRLFRGQKINISPKRNIEIPIVGEHVFGAPVSFVTKKVSDAKVRAEALIAKFNCVKGKLENKKSALYVLTPDHTRNINQKLLENSINELLIVGEANDVSIRFEKDINELARVLLNDEAA